MAFTMVTLTVAAGYRLATGDAVPVRIRATPYVEMVNGTRTIRDEVILPIAANGSATKPLAATTDPATTPAGNVYSFVVEANFRPVRSFLAAVPHNAGSSVDIDTLTPLVAPPDFLQGGTIVVQDEGSTLTARSKINFVGSGVTATDDPGNARTNVTVSGSGTGIAASTVTAKGDLIGGTGNGTVSNRSVGTNGQALLADSAQATGLSWGAPAPAAHNHAASEITSGTVATARLGSGPADATTFLRGDQTWSPGASSPVVAANRQTSDYTLVAGDAGKVVEMDTATPATLTIPASTSVTFAVGTVLEVFQLGAGQVTIGYATGTSFSEPFTSSLALTWATVAGGAISVSGGTQGALSGTDTRVRAQHDVGSADMFTQCTWATGGADTDRAFGVCTRYSSSADTCYVFEVNDNQNRWQLYRFNAGSAVGITGFVTRTIASPITLRLESQGTSHRCYLDGALVQTITDSTISGGQRGGLTGYQPSGILFDNFSTGALATGITVRKPASRVAKTAEQSSTIGLRMRAVDDWVVAGDLAAS